MPIAIHPDSHTDHGLSPEQLAHLLALFADRTSFFIETVELPASLGTVPCGLHLDVPEEECHRAARGDREYASRLCSRKPRQVSAVTVIAGTDRDNPEDATMYLFTAYGGAPAPQEPGDPQLAEEGRAASVAFWAKAALSVE